MTEHKVISSTELTEAFERNACRVDSERAQRSHERLYGRIPLESESAWQARFKEAQKQVRACILKLNEEQLGAIAAMPQQTLTEADVDALAKQLGE